MKFDKNYLSTFTEIFTENEKDMIKKKKIEEKQRKIYNLYINGFTNTVEGLILSLKNSINNKDDDW